MHLARRLQQLPKNVNVRLIKTSTNVAASSPTPRKEQIVIPNRIPRTPTDILHALSSTVGRDPTAPHYKFHDDPYLIPMSNVSKRTFAMAQESGRKAAKWIKEQHRELFQHQEAQPAIEAFAPKMVFTPESEVTPQTLDQLIKQSEIQDAVLVYNLMKEKGLEMSSELKQSLLELISFYNNEELLPEEYFEERWFKQNNEAQQRHRKTWKDGDLAEQIFNEIEPKTVNTYAAIIRGMAKYYQADRAYALFQEAMEKQFQLDTATYNSIISNVNFLKENVDQRWELCKDLLQQMKQQQLKPDLGTMNSLLECISTFGNFKLARNSALQVLSEFKKLDIHPSLGTYYYTLIIFCRERGPVSHVIVDILNEIEGQEFKIQHPKDTFFFTTAMDVCRNHLHDRSLAKKVNDLLHTGNNYELIGDTYKESIYYRHYFALISQTSTIDEFLEIYDLLVPNVYIPEPGIMEEILKMVDINAASELMPRLWSDMVIFDHTNRESLLMKTLKIMMSNKPDVTQKSQQQLPEQFAKVALDIYTKVVESEGKFKKLSFTGQMIGDILSLLVRGDNWEKAVEVFNNIDKNQHRIPGTPSEACLMDFVEASIVNKAPSQALLCLQYAVENHMDGLTLAQRINKGFTLNEVHLSKIKSLVGDSFLKQ